MTKLTSKYLRADDVNNLHEARLFADERGYPLNVTITIKWSLFNGDLSGEQRLASAQERLRHSLKRRNHDLRWAWVREDRNGAHHHILAHDCFNDDGRTFNRLLLRVLEPDGRPIADNAIVIKPTGRGQPGSGGPHGWLRYLAKGLHPVEGARRHIKTAQQGCFTGKRTGMTQNINRAARMRARNGRLTSG
jgi:hypothetical protein